MLSKSSSKKSGTAFETLKAVGIVILVLFGLGLLLVVVPFIVLLARANLPSQESTSK